MDATDVKAKRVQDGVYELSLGKGKDKQTVLATRQPDLYFVIELGGTKHKGYLKDLKAALVEFAQGPQEPAPPVVVDRPAPPGDIIESRNREGRQGKAHARTYVEEGSRAYPDGEDAPLPTMDASGELIAECELREVRPQRASARFPYTEGYAIIEKATRLQTGWTKDKSRAIELMEAKHDAAMGNPGAHRPKKWKAHPNSLPSGMGLEGASSSGRADRDDAS